MKKTIESKEKYDAARHKRQRYVDAVLKSSSRKKIVVAGPGTGKTYLFREILKNKKKSIALTFINSLVEDLSLELYGLSDVKTLHSFARSALISATNDPVNIFPKLSEVIKEDAKILLNKQIEFDYLFHNREGGNEHIEFYERRRNYYDKHYGYSDIIFTIVKHFEKTKDMVPIYEQIVVDEFQDFNKLEVSLIELLAEKSPVLIVGDDDQALYDFKSASTDHIRQRYSDANPDYAPFVLPYCSRCTRVIVETANDIINRATKNGCLSGRINKPYQYFEDEGKDRESNQNPKVIYSQQYARRIPWFITKQIEQIAEEVKDKFSVLIISPTKLQSSTIVDALRNKGFNNVESTQKKDEKGPTLLDGLKILLKDRKGNLGWRIVSKILLEDKCFKDLLKETNKRGAKSIAGIIDTGFKKEVIGLLRVFRALKCGKDVEEEVLMQILRKIRMNPHEILRTFLKDKIVSNTDRFTHRGLRKIPVKATTIQSSKGLAAEYVFITHFDDQYFIKNKDKKIISDRDICNFLVALTRAETKIFLISSNTKKEPTFLEWINGKRIEKE